MATYFAPTFNKNVAPGASTHHCKTKMEQNANDRDPSSLQHIRKSDSVELMTNPSIHNLNKALNNNIQFNTMILNSHTMKNTLIKETTLRFHN